MRKPGGERWRWHVYGATRFGDRRGIGRATASLLAKQGAVVVINFVARQDAAEDAARAIRADGGQAVVMQGDVRSREQVEDIIAKIDGRWGRLDILINNAGMPFVRKPLRDMAWAEFQQKLDDEMKAAFVLTQAVTPVMARHHYGRIVYVGSGLSKHTAPDMAAHGTAKAALTQFARYVAAEYGPVGITANVVSPGMVHTEATAFQPQNFLDRVAAMTPLGRIAEPDDVARAIVMYASRDSGFITGTYIPVNGGSSME